MLTCEATNGTFTCKTDDETERATIQALQQVIRDAATKLAVIHADMPPMLTTLRLDGRVGAATAIGAQFLLTTLNHWAPLPADLRPILAYQASVQDIIQRVAEQTPALGRYITSVLSVFPQALTSAPPRPQRPVGEAAPPPTTGTDKIKATAKKALGVGLGLAAIGGGVFFTRRHLAKTRGLVDQSHLLPGSDEDDGDED